MSVESVLGVLGVVLFSAMFVPQMVRLRRTRDVTGISVLSAAVTVVYALAWTLYSFAVLDLAQIVANTPVAVVAAIIWVLVARGAGRSLLPGAVLFAAALGTLVALLAVAGAVTVGLLGAALGITRTLPQAWLVLRGPAGSGLSKPSAMLQLGSAVTWTAYGIVGGYLPVVVSAAVQIPFCLLVAVRCVQRDRGVRRASPVPLAGPARTS